MLNINELLLMMTQGQVKLHLLLKHLGLNIPALSAYLGIERQRLYDIQSGKTKKFSFELATIINNVYEDINIDWLLGNSEEITRTSYNEQEITRGNPFFENFTAQCGNGHGDGQEEAVDPDGYMCVPGINTSPDIPFLQVRGRSMVNTNDPEHSISPGSWVAVKRVLGEAIHWGEVYAVMTVDGPIIKRLMPSEKENHVRCESFNESYPAFDLPATDIVENGIYIVKGVVNVQVWN